MRRWDCEPHKATYLNLGVQAGCLEMLHLVCRECSSPGPFLSVVIAMRNLEGWDVSLGNKAISLLRIKQQQVPEHRLLSCDADIKQQVQLPSGPLSATPIGLWGTGKLTQTWCSCCLLCCEQGRLLSLTQESCVFCQLPRNTRIPQILRGWGQTIAIKQVL